MHDGAHESGKRPRDAAPDDVRLDDAVRSAYLASRAEDPAAEARLLERIGRPGPTGLRWWFAAQLFELRPAAAFALAVLLLAAGVWGGVRWASRAAPAGVADRSAALPTTGVHAAALAGGIPVTFVLRAPGATSVSVAGDFNNWDAAATPMSPAGTGDLWIVNVELPRGVHLYSFVLDGAEWRPDPSAPLAADDAFGGRNSVIVVNGGKRL